MGSLQGQLQEAFVWECQLLLELADQQYETESELEFSHE